MASKASGMMMPFLLKINTAIINWSKPRPYLLKVQAQQIFCLQQVFYLLLAYNPILKNWYVTDIHFPTDLVVRDSKINNLLNKIFPKFSNYLRLKFNCCYSTGVYSVLKTHLRIDEKLQIAVIQSGEPLTGDFINKMVIQTLENFNKKPEQEEGIPGSIKPINEIVFNKTMLN